MYKTMAKHVVYNIEYDTDGEKVELPDRLEIELPDDITDPDEIAEELSDAISDITGFCHFGFMIEGEE